ncbi:MAG: DNA-binding protein [Burkholderiales bacterium RIFCSPLOWO2_02_FULL_57_36]|nr:MAG: DNA-binding protein [Burkholderiales bacterium RIFCSPLOWO2_02_FULL_57_36]
MKASVIDIFEFCRLKEKREGEVAVADLNRLAGEAADESGMLRWSLQGGSNKTGCQQLMLTVSGPVHLRCQRCLTSFAFSIESESTLVLAADEKSADEIDRLLDDESIEVIVGSREFDILRLIEDEALLALPLAPKHEVCPDSAALDALEGVKKDSPFSVLKNLK